MSDLTERLRALSRAEHDDLSVAGEAVDKIEDLKNKILLRDTSIVQSMTMKSKMLTDLEELKMEVECEEKRFNDLSDMYATLSKKCDKYRAQLAKNAEVLRCAEEESKNHNLKLDGRYRCTCALCNAVRAAREDRDEP